MLKCPVWLILLLAILIMTDIAVCGQTISHVSIEQVYQLAQKNYPLIKQRDLIAKASDYSVSNAAKGYLPALVINGQATYQSTVTSFPFTVPVPGFTLPTYSKDQYRVYGEIDQVVFDGGAIKNQKQTARVNDIIQEQNLEVTLYALYDRVNQLFFGTLLINEQLKQNDLLKQDILNGISKAKALVANGTAYRSSVEELQAQLLQAQQAMFELKAGKKAYLSMLSLFINSPLDESCILDKPAPPAYTDDRVTRPELLAYDLQKRNYDLQRQMLNIQLLPKFGFFAQGGYGRPGLNSLNNNFAWYYIGGLKLSWNFGSLYTLKNQRQILDIDKTSLDVQKETFLFNTTLIQKQQQADIEKYNDLFKQDNAIIALRESVKKAASAQLENGVLSAHDYINQVNAEDQARQNLILHQIELLQSQYNYQNTIGNIKNQ